MTDIICADCGGVRTISIEPCACGSNTLASLPTKQPELPPDTYGLVCKARTMAAYAMNLAQGAVLTEFEIDNVIALANDLGVDISAYRDNMRKQAAALNTYKRDLADAQAALLEATEQLRAWRALPWWRRMVGR